MKNISTILSVVAIIATSVLFFLYFSDKRPAKPQTVQVAGATPGAKSFTIAYFEMDSVETNFAYIKELMEKISDKERTLVGELTSLQRKYQTRAGELQQKAQTMTQAEGEAANREMANMDQRLKEKKGQVDQEMFDFKNSLLQDARTKIEEYLKEYNKQKRYSYIFSYEPGFIYYRDSAYNVTQDLVDGLNAKYKKK